ncbi:hypothetical protein NZK81_14655 [Novosphingobium sp. HK4-1]|uniref:Uncharacterized protein n=1 Tax=Novosphingobium mangrovi (ex Huang et al. 2023) TaxID=2976432 RepID=A0ABT2I7K8_9SPHN|nr:hypothetical protein [Novosphingobium mangrovi (ex Huang et al. 2023)]
MNLPFIDRIWSVRGSLTLDPFQSPAEAFGKLDGLFRAEGTSHKVEGDTLTFSKKDPLAQDKMATFNGGMLRVVEGGEGPELVYDLRSSALLFCFVLPFFFLGIAWLIKDSRTPAYVFAGLFTVLYVVGRILEPRLIKSVFRKRLSGETLPEGEVPLAQ